MVIRKHNEAQPQLFLVVQAVGTPTPCPWPWPRPAKSMPAKIAMMAITTSNSISVNPFEYGYFVFILKKQSRKATLMPKRGKPFFLPLAERQKPKSGARFPGSPFSVLGARF